MISSASSAPTVKRENMNGQNTHQAAREGALSPWHREPYLKLLKCIAKRRDIPPAAKLVAAAIADRMGDKDHCWPGVRTLAADVGLHPNGAVKAMQALEAKGVITVRRSRDGKANIYGFAQLRDAQAVTDREPSTGPERHTQCDARATHSVTPAGPARHTQCDARATHSVTEAPHCVLLNETDSLNETPPGGGQGSRAALFDGAPPPKQSSPTETGRLMALWAKGHKMRTGKPLPDSARGRIAGTIKAMLADFPADDLVAAVGRWFGADRESFGIALFKHRLEDGDAELTGRRTTKAGPRGPGPGRGVQMAPGALAEIERMTMQFEASALEVSHGCDHEQTN